MAGEAHGGAVAHENAHLQQSHSQRLGMIAHARENEVGLRGRGRRSPLGQLRKEARALGEDEGARPLQMLRVVEGHHRRDLGEAIHVEGARTRLSQPIASGWATAKPTRRPASPAIFENVRSEITRGQRPARATPSGVSGSSQKSR